MHSSTFSVIFLALLLHREYKSKWQRLCCHISRLFYIRYFVKLIEFAEILLQLKVTLLLL